MSTPYKVYSRDRGDKRELIAKFARGWDAYDFGKRAATDPTTTITVYGWDKTIWWQFRRSEQITPPLVAGCRPPYPATI